MAIHYFGALGSAEQTCAFFKLVNRKASAHYFVEDGGVWQCVEDKNAAWHCGDGGAGQYKAVCKNANSIGIEVRPYKVNLKSLLASDKDWYFHEATIANLTKLVRSLMAQHGIDADHVIRHNDVTAKACPRPWVGDDINTYYGKTGNRLWAEFKAGLTESEDDNMIRYNTLDNIPNEYGFRDIIEILMNANVIKGDGSDPNGNGDVIDLSHDQVRSLVFEYRGGAFDRKLIAEGKEPAVSV